MIEQTTGFKTSNNELFVDLHDAQKRELLLLLAGAGAASQEKKEANERVIAAVMANKAQVLEILADPVAPKRRNRSGARTRANRSKSTATPSAGESAQQQKLPT